MSITLLIIEDSTDHARITARILQKANSEYQIDFAYNAEEGIGKLKQNKYDLILCDYHLPGLTALDIMKEIAQSNNDLPFVVVTSQVNVKEAVEIMKQGAYDYLSEDNSYEDILPVIIQRSLERHREKMEQKQTRETLGKIKQQQEAILNNISDIAWLKDRDCRFVAVNESFGNACGFDPKDIAGKTDFDIWPQELARKYQKDDRDVMEMGKRKCVEEPLANKDGAYSWIETIKTPVYDEQNRIIGTTGIARDITKRIENEEKLKEAYQKLKDAQEQLIQTDKMAAIGQLAAGISHELNQPLTGIRGFTQILLMESDKKSGFYEDLLKIIEQTDRMDKIIKNISFFSRKSDFEMNPMNIHEPIEASFELLNQQLEVHNIRVVKSFAANIANIQGNNNQLQQVFLNLITNARDAIAAAQQPEGGELAVATALSPEGDRIIVTIRDNGVGISQQELPSIFNPFFTTKCPDRGIGLGLSIVYRIIENHKGTITAASAAGEGTTFTLTLPAA